MNVIFICTGNTCRSPMAEGLFRQLLERRGITSVEVSSAGLSAFAGDPACENAVAALSQVGVSLAAHRSRPLNLSKAQEADFLVVMTESHRQALLSVLPEKASAVRLLSPGQIPDPYGGDLALYCRTRDLIAASLPALLEEMTEGVFPFSPGDGQQIAEIEKLSFSLPWSLQAIEDFSSQPHARLLVYRRGARVLGYIGLYLILDTGDITNIAVRPEVQGQGIGSALLTEMLALVRSEGGLQVNLEVRASHENVISFYRRHGFVPTGLRKNFYQRPTEDGLLMTACLGISPETRKEGSPL